MRVIKNILSKPGKTAYSLVELSIVITILSVIITGGLSVLTTSANNAKIQVTKDRMAEIYRAMGAYLLYNRALPCPAPITDIKTSSTTYGDITGTAGTCTTTGVYDRVTGTTGSAYGMIPTQDLGLPAIYAEDGFGSKFTYVVAKVFTDPSVTTSDTTGFGRAVSSSILTVNDKVVGSTQVATADAIFVIISHGVNKYGAYDANSATQNGTASDADEITNHGTLTGGTGDATFYATSTGSDVFDDIVFYRTRNEMAAEFDALDLIVCKSGGDQTINGVDHTWPTALPTSPTGSWPILPGYNQHSMAAQDCASGWQARNKRPLKKCGAFGVWESDVSTPCYSS